jgi:hypothetical protein
MAIVRESSAHGPFALTQSVFNVKMAFTAKIFIFLLKSKPLWRLWKVPFSISTKM